ncbi:uncharacterized protein LOC117600023 [Osmia lignaria lignaria]|uniref:uncharacterized protein LOC117600023 n=1 Tax=Osmia lignaria lignaria TaxID=1437193 RepID=UPI00402B0AA9
MIFRFILICLLLRTDVRAEDRFQRTPQDADGARYCDFDEARKNYNVTDLLQCIDRLAADLADRESDRLMNGKDQWNGSTGRQISFMDIFSSFFQNDPSVPHQGNPFPVYPTSGQHQPNYPAVSGGTFQLNLFDALSSISRHDDYKCIPRILCEMASGKLPGRSLGKQWSGFFEFLGRNSFTGLLTKFDVETASPLLNFGRAMLLGYSNRGSSAVCYETFPKCPRNMNALIYYLNNYNGGFFRLFNKVQGGKYRENIGIRDHRDNYSKIVLKGRIISGTKDYRIGPVRNEIYFPSVKYYEHNEKQKFSDYEKPINDNEIVFPGQKTSKNEPVRNSLQNYVQKLEPNIWQNNIAFFPEEITNQRFSRFRFPPNV